MRYLFLLSLAPVLSVCLLAPAEQRPQPKPRCLPAGVNLTDVVLADQTDGTNQPLRVSQRLAQLKARCRRGKLVDARGREIRFYRRTDCWGNPPFDAEERTARQNDEIKELGKRYTVVVLACENFGMMTP